MMTQSHTSIPNRDSLSFFNCKLSSLLHTHTHIPTTTISHTLMNPSDPCVFVWLCDSLQGVHLGAVLLTDSTPDEDEDVADIKPPPAQTESTEPEPPEPFEWIPN